MQGSAAGPRLRALCQRLPLRLASLRPAPKPAPALPLGAQDYCSPSSSPASQPRPPRFYVPAPLAGTAAGGLVRLELVEARHATRTLRLREGDRLELCDGQGGVVVAELAALDRSGALARTLAAAEAAPAAAAGAWRWEVAAACGSLKGGRGDWLVEKCTELGAAAFLPLLTERSPTIGGGGGGSGGGVLEKKGRRKRAAEGEGGEEAEATCREGRWQRVATAAMKQSLRAHALALLPPTSVQQLCERVGGAAVAMVGVGGAPPMTAALAAAAAEASAAAAPAATAAHTGILIVGPEGDFTPAELAALTAAGAVPVGLGSLRLRAETAAIAMLAAARLQLP